jgi:DNA invertase Pin-like site-specific DNA recombinase
MRFMGVPTENIAREIGISRRTYFRVLQQIQHKNLDPDTPFSKWI